MDTKHFTFRGATAASIVSDAAKQGVPSHVTGTWAIHAEDANCDLGGPHSEPYIASFTGTLREAAIHATSTLRSQYIGWGGGGHVAGEVNVDMLTTPAAAARASADPVRDTAERLAVAKRVLERAQAEHDRALRDSECRISCLKKLEPITKLLSDAEAKVAVEIFTGIINNRTTA